MKKMTQKEKDAAFMEHLRQSDPEIFVSGSLDIVTETLKKEVARMKLVKAIPAQVEVLAAMQRALTELDALQQKYYPDEDAQAA